MNSKPRHISESQINWLNVFLLVYGLFVFLPFLAPLMMKWDLPAVGRIIYFIYSFFCHQLPERSLFFFGPRWMYSISEIGSVWQNTDNPLILRQFIGNSQMGWKVAWSDRMISMYGGIWLAALVWSFYRKHRKLSVWIFILLASPMVLDGFTHLMSDFSGLAAGFRYTNHWLAVVTLNYFPSTFYIGDSLGSFNSSMRWLSGFLFAFGFVWWLFPYLFETSVDNSLAISNNINA